MVLTEVAQSFLQGVKEFGKVLDNGSAIGILDLQALNEMTQRGKGSGGEGARGLLSQGDAQTLKDDGLGRVGDAVVLDVRLEIVQLRELRIRGG